MKQTQFDRLKESVGEVLGQDFSFTAKWDDAKGMVSNAKINTKEHLSKEKIKMLDHIADSWWFRNWSIKRSGHGLTFEFMEAKKELATTES